MRSATKDPAEGGNVPPVAAYLGLVPGLSLGPAAVGYLLILGLDLSDDAIQVQGAAVVHGEDHGCVRDLGLQL